MREPDGDEVLIQLVRFDRANEGLIARTEPVQRVEAGPGTAFHGTDPQHSDTVVITNHEHRPHSTAVPRLAGRCSDSPTVPGVSEGWAGRVGCACSVRISTYGSRSRR